MNDPSDGTLFNLTSTPPDFELLAQLASTVFVPASPITNVDLFAGRIRQIQTVIDAINQPGQHAILFGDRGVGKTSLANVLAPLARAVNPRLVAAKVNCDGTDSLESAWRKALAELKWVVEKHTAGFTGEIQRDLQSLAERVPAPCTPNDLRLLLASLPVPTVLVFDEFDRLPAKESRVFTDLIKTLSDYTVPTTVVLVGVASTVDQLIRDHASIERALVQVPMQRMEPHELRQIIDTGAKKLGLHIEPRVAQQIVQISQGLPHYTHLISLYTVRFALRRRSLTVSPGDLDRGIEEAVSNATHSIKTQYHRATSSSHKSALFEQVLLACALTKKDQLSYFRAADVEGPLSAIMGKNYDVPAFARHLSEFCTESRARVLDRQGPSRRIRYRFTNPLLEPYVVMNGRARNLITAELLSSLASTE